MIFAITIRPTIAPKYMWRNEKFLEKAKAGIPRNVKADTSVAIMESKDSENVRLLPAKYCSSSGSFSSNFLLDTFARKKIPTK